MPGDAQKDFEEAEKKPDQGAAEEQQRHGEGDSRKCLGEAEDQGAERGGAGRERDGRVHVAG